MVRPEAAYVVGLRGERLRSIIWRMNGPRSQPRAVRFGVLLGLGKPAVAHENLGATWIPRAKDDAGDRARSLGFNAGQSVIWLLRPTFNALVELAWTRGQDVVGPGRTARRDTLHLSPGVRWAYNFASGLQIVPGLAVPIGIGPSRGDTGAFLYLSFEHPFRHAK